MSMNLVKKTNDVST